MAATGQFKASFGSQTTAPCRARAKVTPISRRYGHETQQQTVFDSDTLPEPARQIGVHDLYPALAGVYKIFAVG